MVREVLPRACVIRIAKKATSGMRVSGEAKEYLREVASEFVREVAKRSGTFAKHAKRSTIMRDDIKLALNEILNVKLD